MRLIILPGLDGSGEIYSAFIRELTEDIQITIISYPKQSNLDYADLIVYVSNRLPEDEKFIILAESFSGPIGYQLAKRALPNLVAIIFVASFIRNPNRKLISLSRLLPLSLILRLPIPDFIVKRWLFGANVAGSMISKFKTIVRSLPSCVIRARLGLIQKLILEDRNITLPTLYIQALNDRLVLTDNCQDFESRCTHFTQISIDGPHFLLQSKPLECANHVRELIQQVFNPKETT